jgi:fibronectin-binding autotransporter adhesin
MADKARKQRANLSINSAVRGATPKLWLTVIAAAAAVVGLGRTTRATVVIDGSLDSDYTTSNAVNNPGTPVFQTNNTGFGDNTATNGDPNGIQAGGSELDGAYAVVQGGNLDLMFTGNVETNFNHLNIWIADGRAGQNTLNAAGSISSMSGSKFSPNFNATYALDINGGINNPNPLTFFINSNDLTQANGPSSFLGSFAPTAIGQSFVVGGITFSVNNSNFAGVNGVSPSAASQSDAAAVTTGFEMAIPLTLLGSPHGTIQVVADINGNSNGFLSNQFLPGIPLTNSANPDGSSNNVGSGGTPISGTAATKFDLSAIPNDWLSVTVPSGGITSGVWNAAAGGSWGIAGNWTSAGIPGNPGDTATFGTSATGAANVTLDGSRTVGQITFNNSVSYTLSQGTGGTLTINDTNDPAGVNPAINVTLGNHIISAPVSLFNGVTITTSDNTSLTVSAPGSISGTGPLTKAGNGALILSNTNTYTGSMTILAGSVTLNTASAIPAGSEIDLGNTTADNVIASLFIGTSGLTITNNIVTNHDDSGMDNVRVIGTSFASGSATFSGPLTLNGGALLSANAGTTLFYSGLISDGSDTSGDAKFDVLANSNGSLGTVVLPNANTYAGITAVDAGTLVLGNSSAASSGNIFVGNGGGGFAATNAALLANADGLNIANPIITNKADDGTNLGTGTRTIGGTNTSGTVTYSGGLTLNGGAVLAAAAGGTVNFSGVIADGTDTGNVSHDITISGPGTVTFSNVNTYSGATIVNAGLLNVAAGGSLPTTTNLTVGDGTDVARVSLPAFAPGSGVQPLTVGSINMQQNGTLAVAAPDVQTDRAVLVTNGLNFNGGTDSWQGLVDLNTNDMIVHGGTTSLANVTNQIKEGYSNSHWTGTAGITSSTLKAAAAAPNSKVITTLGVEVNDDGTGSGTPLTTAFDGQPVSDGDILVKYTYYGDANLDGVVDASDYILIDTGFSSQTTASPLSGWQHGDFNYDGSINGDDYTLIDNAFNTQGGVSLAATSANSLAFNTSQIAAVPEPASVSMIAIGAVGLLKRRRRRI